VGLGALGVGTIAMLSSSLMLFSAAFEVATNSIVKLIPANTASSTPTKTIIALVLLDERKVGFPSINDNDVLTLQDQPNR